MVRQAWRLDHMSDYSSVWTVKITALKCVFTRICPVQSIICRVHSERRNSCQSLVDNNHSGLTVYGSLFNSWIWIIVRKEHLSENRNSSTSLLLFPSKNKHYLKRYYKIFTRPLNPKLVLQVKINSCEQWPYISCDWNCTLVLCQSNLAWNRTNTNCLTQSQMRSVHLLQTCLCTQLINSFNMAAKTTDFLGSYARLQYNRCIRHQFKSKII